MLIQLSLKLPWPQQMIPEPSGIGVPARNLAKLYVVNTGRVRWGSIALIMTFQYFLHSNLKIGTSSYAYL